MKRFWIKADVRGQLDCWKWTGHVTPNGYGQFGLNRKIEYAHRVAWFLKTGSWPQRCVLHSCDNRRCVNPAHLFEGTHRDNYQDMVSKGRRRITRSPGESHGMAKLREADVLWAMRMRGKMLQKDIASALGIDPSLVSQIHRGKIWRHVTTGLRPLAP